MNISERQCIECRIPLDGKTGYKRGLSGYLPRCKVCHGYYVRDRQNSICRGDLSAREYDDLMDKCRGRCGLCGRVGNRALCYKGLYGIYCDWCAGAIEGGPDLLNKALAYVGGGVEPAPDVW
jgi:hypothetical protein